MIPIIRWTQNVSFSTGCHIKRMLLVLLTVIGLTASALGMPLASSLTGQNLTTPVADGCWLGWYRNAFGGCSRDQYGLLGLGIEFKPGPYYPTGPNVCRGRGMYQVCNVFGFCWSVCN